MTAPRQRPPGTTIAPPRDDLALDYANTLCWRGSDPPSEALRKPDDAIDWCATTGGLGGEAVKVLRRSARENPAQADALFAASVSLRETLFRLFSALAAGGEPAAADVAAFNAALALAPGRRQLRRIGPGFVWQAEMPAPTAAAMLAPVLWSAGDLLASARSRRVRQCANAKCLWLFLDDSKSGTRRWCSMSSCGNRAKAHRHYVKTRQGGED